MENNNHFIRDVNNNADDGNTPDYFGARTLMQNSISRLLGVIPKPIGMSSEVMSVTNNSNMKMPRPHHLQPLSSNKAGPTMSKRNKDELLRISELRGEQAYLSRSETAEYRNTYYQNLCLNILKDGYHRTFSELFSLVSHQEKARHLAGPDSILWQLTPLNLQSDKLILLRDQLCKAEDSTRRRDHVGAYLAYQRLARAFEPHPDDKWLSDHFYGYCLETGCKIEDDGRYRAEASLNMGITLENNGDPKEALTHLKQFYKLSAEKEWADDEEQLLHLTACKHLARVFTKVADLLPVTDDSRVVYYKDAHEMAKESSDKSLEGLCGYRLGLAYEQLGKPDTALLYLRGFYDLSKDIHDDENLGLACEAMAKAFERQGKTTDSIQFLQEFVEVTARSNQDRMHSRACRDLGAVYNNILHDYVEAAKYFSKSFTVARSLNDTQAANGSRMLCGVANGNKMTSKYAHHIVVSTRHALERVIEWKNSRGDDNKLFGSPIGDEPNITLNSRKPVRMPKYTN